MQTSHVFHGDNREILRSLIQQGVQVDAVVTDPPYGLSFMSKRWDYDVPSIEQWQLVLQVLKPGGHILTFGGTRTYHRMVVNLEDSGFEIRDQLAWVYSSGLPKSQNVSKAIDKQAGAKRTQFQVNQLRDTRVVRNSGNAAVLCAICGETTVGSQGLI